MYLLHPEKAQELLLIGHCGVLSHFCIVMWEGDLEGGDLALCNSLSSKDAWSSASHSRAGGE